MRSNFTKQLLNFIELYRYNPALAEFSVGLGYLALVLEHEKVEQIDSTAKILKNGEKRSRRYYRDRVMDTASSEKADLNLILERLVEGNYDQNIDTSMIPTDIRRSIFDGLKQMQQVHLKFREWQIQHLAQAFDMSIEEARRISTEVEDRERHEKFGSIDLSSYLTKSFLNNLDSRIGKIEALEKFEIGLESLPQLGELLREAHQCFLLNMDSAVAMLCGATLEFALKEKLSTKVRDLDEVLEDALKSGLLNAPSDLYTAADEIREIRNKALHNATEFSRASVEVKATLLMNTRRLVIHLYKK